MYDGCSHGYSSLVWHLSSFVFLLIISFCTSEIPGLPSGVAKRKGLERNSICGVVTMNEITVNSYVWICSQSAQ